MTPEETRIRILLKMDGDSGSCTESDPEFNEQGSCVICNSKAHIKTLEPQRINRRLKEGDPDA